MLSVVVHLIVLLLFFCSQGVKCFFPAMHMTSCKVFIVFHHLASLRLDHSSPYMSENTTDRTKDIFLVYPLLSHAYHFLYCMPSSYWLW